LEEVYKEEMKFVIHIFQKDKIQGLHGWPMEFFLGFSEVIEGDLLIFVDESRRTRKMLASFNATL
jgi:hypothetical protein